MNFYRKWCLCRRLQQQEEVFILIGFLFTYSLVCLHLNRIKSLKLPINCYCSKSSLVIFEHGECFFNQHVCHPGFDGNQCEIPLKNEV
jgi:hypothetical protein